MTKVALGYDHSCALTSAGAIWCWGGNFRGELGDGQLGGVTATPRRVMLPQGYRPVEIVAGEVFTCAFDRDREMVCWGSNGENQLGLEALGPNPRFDAVGLAWGSACGADGGDVRCWGQQSARAAQRVHARGSTVTALSLTLDDVVCALHEDGEIACVTLQGVPRDGFATDERFSHLDGAGGYRCARSVDGKITCRDRWGQPAKSPDDVVETPRVFKVGHLTGCLLDDGPLRCWGEPGASLLGEPYSDRSTAATPAVQEVLQVVAGGTSTCVRHRDGAVTCWGSDVLGATGTGTENEDRVPPTRLEGLLADGLDASVDHVCARGVSGEVWCWGSNARGQVEPGGPRVVTTPRRVPDVGVVAGIAAGRHHTCALDDIGQVRCWGFSAHLGGGANGAVVAGLPRIVSLDAGEHTCAVDADGGVWCWGRNERGQADGLGRVPHTDPLRAPVRIEGVDDAVQVTLGDTHSCARLASGRVSCWGGNQIGQAGLRGVSRDAITPSFVLDLDDAVDVDAGPFHTCAVRAAGGVVCWGEEQNRRLGAAEDASVLEGATVVPRIVDVVGVAGAVGVSAGHNHACAVVDDGTVRCWGNDGSGVVTGAVPSARALVVLPAPR